MIWTACFALTLICAGLSALARDWQAMRACLAVAGGLVLTLVFLWGMPPDWALTAYGALWVSVGGMVIRSHPIGGALLITSGLCYLWAWLVSAPIEAGQAPYIAADLFGVLALLVICGRAARGLVGAIGDLGGRGSRRGDLDMVGRNSLAKEAGP